jgi:hypothetical protein
VPLHWRHINGDTSGPRKLGIDVTLGGGSAPQFFEFDTGGDSFYATFHGTKPPTGSARVARESPRGQGPTALSSSRRLSFSTGSPIACRRRASTGIACRLETSQGCLHPITSSGGP